MFSLREKILEILEEEDSLVSFASLRFQLIVDSNDLQETLDSMVRVGEIINEDDSYAI